jgi:1-acyl-sn-glycerol-3-phosphate acyltransferase
MTPRPDGRHAEAATEPPLPPLAGAALLVAACRSLATYIILSLYVLLVGPPGLLLAWLFKWPAVLYVLSHGGVRMALGLAGIRYQVTGRERLPRDRAAVYCANHTSNIDAPLLFHLLHPRLHMLYKAEFGRMPILGRAAPLGGFVAVERQNPEQSQRAVDEAAASVAAGNSFMVFPEGTRSRTGDLLPFKKGGFIMAIKAQAPLVPVAIAGGRAAMTKGSRLIRPVSVRISIGEPIETSGMTLDDRDRLSARARGQIEGMLGTAGGGSRTQKPSAGGGSPTP